MNVSRSGVLLRPVAPFPADGEVEILMTLPPCDAFPRARVRCVASVIRREADGPAAALAIHRYRFLKPADPDEADIGDGEDFE